MGLTVVRQDLVMHWWWKEGKSPTVGLGVSRSGLQSRPDQSRC